MYEGLIQLQTSQEITDTFINHKTELIDFVEIKNAYDNPVSQGSKYLNTVLHSGPVVNSAAE